MNFWRLSFQETLRTQALQQAHYNPWHKHSAHRNAESTPQKGIARPAWISASQLEMPIIVIAEAIPGIPWVGSYRGDTSRWFTRETNGQPKSIEWAVGVDFMGGVDDDGQSSWQNVCDLILLGIAMIAVTYSVGNWFRFLTIILIARRIQPSLRMSTFVEFCVT